MAEFYHRENPFIKDLKKKVKWSMRSRKQVGPILMADGEFMYDENGLVMVATHTGSFPHFEDNEQFVKLYIEFVSILRKINSAGIIVFSHILEISQPKHDIVYLNSAEICTKLGVSRTHVYQGIRSLCRESLIARAYTGKRNSVAYWINPTVFYNGNRQHLLLKSKK